MRSIIGVTVVCALVFATAAKCPAGDSNPSNETDAPGFSGQTVQPQGPPSCSITGRGQSSKGQYYVSYGCTNGTTGAFVLSGPNDLPNCRVGTFWDNCAK